MAGSDNQNSKRNDAQESQKEIDDILGQIQETSGKSRNLDAKADTADDIIRKPEGSASESEGLGSILDQIEEKAEVKATAPAAPAPPAPKKKVGFFQKLMNLFRK